MTSRQQQAGIRRTLIILLVIIVAVLALTVHKVLRPQALNEQQLQALNAFVFDQPRRFSDLALLDHRQQPFTREKFLGQWSLVYFGFTHCPDICPTGLMDINRVLAGLPAPLQENTQVVLVSLDPVRDTPEVLAQYVTAFNPDFTGVTGDFVAIRRFANELNVAFAKTRLGDDYTIDHSTHLVLLNPAGDFHGFFRPPFHPDTLGTSLPAIVSQWR